MVIAIGLVVNVLQSKHKGDVSESILIIVFALIVLWVASKMGFLL